MRLSILFLLLSTSIYSANSFFIHSIYSKVGYIDYASSRYNYESDLFGVSLGSKRDWERASHLFNGDISVGISGRRGQDNFSDRPFYAQVKASYDFHRDIKYIGRAALGLGLGGEYNLEGIVPGNLDGPGISWIQNISLTLNIYSRFEISNERSLFINLLSPVTGIINRPEWTGSISKEIEDLYKDDITGVLFKRGKFYTPLDYQSFTFKIIYRERINSRSEFYIEEGVTYSTTDIPREYSRFLNRFAFGINYLTNSY